MRNTLKYIIPALAIAALLIAGCSAEGKTASPQDQQALPAQSGQQIQETDLPPVGQAPAEQGGNTPPAAQEGITQQQLAAHSSAQDCWIVFVGKVYDISTFVPLHPGGPGKITPHCGKTTLEDVAVAKHGVAKIAEQLLKVKLIGPYAG